MLGRSHLPALVLALLALTACAPTPHPPSVAGVTIVAAPAEGEVAAQVTAAAADAARAQRRLVVYVGATWCKPCTEFHDAVERGELAELKPAVTLLEFDLDRDKERLAAAGYAGQYVPLLALPEPDGRASPRVSSGVQTGSAYVPQVRERLVALLAP